MMRVGCFVNDLSDDGLRFYKQIGVNDVDLALDLVPGYKDTGSIELTTLLQVKEQIEKHGLRIELANLDWIHIRDAYFGYPGGDRQIENLCAVVRHVGSAGIPLLGIRPNNAGYWPPYPPPSYYRDKGRGGYEQHAFDLDKALHATDAPAGKVDAEDLWQGYFRVYQDAIPVAEESGVILVQHGNDPPIPVHRGIPHILNNFAAFDRLFERVPSRNNCMNYCVGTRYESGEDVFEGIRHFGNAGRIHHVHFRNVIGPIPKRRGYRETFLDDGDMDMGLVIKTLREVGYDGVVNIDHIPIIGGDSPDQRQGVAWLVAYTKALLAVSDPETRG